MLELKDLGFGFNGVPLFSRLNISIKAGNLCAINGANGSGKTTLLTILAGLRHPTFGECIFAESLSQEPIAYLPADFNGHFMNQGAMSNLKFWTKLAGVTVSNDDLMKLCAEWQLPNVALTRDLSVMRFSTGMKRKLALIRLALIKKPIWLLDEPLLGLDKYAVSSFNNLLQQHLDANGACVIVSHDFDKIKVRQSCQTLTLSQASERQ